MSASEQTLSLGFSPCPNDTFIFHALVHGQIKLDSLSFLPPVIEDVETLNQFALQGKLDVSKVSFHALGHLLEEYVLLDAGAALGRGCGPLLVANKPCHSQKLNDLLVAIPGELTTAAMLLRIYAPEINRIKVMPFDQIMENVKNGLVDAGVIIHESRFTYPAYGLQLVQDLGAWWEEETGLPIPLGGIVARRNLGDETLRKLAAGIRLSVRAAFADPAAGRSYVKKNAREMDDEVMAAHIKLYVNSFSEGLGEEGMTAVQEFLRRGREAGLFKPSRVDFSL